VTVLLAVIAGVGLALALGHAVFYLRVTAHLDRFNERLIAACEGGDFEEVERLLGLDPRGAYAQMVREVLVARAELGSPCPCGARQDEAAELTAAQIVGRFQQAHRQQVWRIRREMILAGVAAVLLTGAAVGQLFVAPWRGWWVYGCYVVGLVVILWAFAVARGIERKSPIAFERLRPALSKLPRRRPR
jgi:hypothetical protein